MKSIYYKIALGLLAMLVLSIVIFIPIDRDKINKYYYKYKIEDKYGNCAYCNDFIEDHGLFLVPLSSGDTIKFSNVTNVINIQ